jgi:hypothetical protein
MRTASARVQLNGLASLVLEYPVYDDSSRVQLNGIASHILEHSVDEDEER